MNCQRCSKQATLHITEILGEDRLEEVHLCETCAKKYLAETESPKPHKAAAESPEVEETGDTADKQC
jgi:protein arginine kinase activator